MSPAAMALPVFCLAHAGGSALAYQAWQRAGLQGLAIEPLELPGRGARWAEPLVDDLSQLVEQLAAALATRLPPRYALFGHSLGALIAFELAHALVERGLPAPVALFAAGASAPSHRDDAHYRALALADDNQLKNELRRLGGTPEELLDNEELMALMLPILAADFRLCASFKRRDRPALSCPLHVFGGTQDASVPDSALAGWEGETTGPFSVERFEGGHFFVQRQGNVLLRRLQRLTTPQVMA
ncbi:alpha/beta fold hydrolase [Jeongeupia wiesaeckerbachi]|uniref:thioesterase II family protein n=1 Tax=Jeongeupia wiesaeckerbachi TaxID=3051218 RepID=UPI003D802D05